MRSAASGTGLGRCSVCDVRYSDTTWTTRRYAEYLGEAVRRAVSLARYPPRPTHTPKPNARNHALRTALSLYRESGCLGLSLQCMSALRGARC
eukprot:428103-Rhodomonas_salina.2